MIPEFIAYLFPPRNRADRLPLLPGGWIDPADDARPASNDQRYLMAYAVVRTTRQAETLIESERAPVFAIARQRRKRRRFKPLKRAWKRFRNLFE